MTKKEIRTAAKAMIMAGSSRQQVYEALQAQSTMPVEKLATLVRYIPTLEARQKYHTAWVALIVLLLMGIVGKLFMAALLIRDSGSSMWPTLLLFPLINVALAIGVIQYRGEAFRFVAVLSILGVLRSVGREAAGGFGWEFLVDLLFACALIALGLYLNSRMVSEPKEVKEGYTNAQGQERLRNKLVFEER